MLQKKRLAAIHPLMAGIVCFSAGLGLFRSASAQTTIPLTDLSSFKTPAKTWTIAGDVSADLAKANDLNVTPGTGVLANLPTNANRGADLFSNLEHGDMDLELEYLIAKGSNSGIYMQGRYEIQLIDNWGSKNLFPGANGGIYQRWDDSKPDGQKGFEGTAPRQNATKAPGLWQKMRISFQAPRFDASGNKIENAKILRVELNGVTIHEDVELTGPTRGAMANNEVATGPIRIQGDHGPIAFRNIRYTLFDKPRPELVNLKYSVYKGSFNNKVDFAKLPPEAQGTLPILSASSINKVPSEYFIRYTGTLRVKEAGEYRIGAGVPGGSGVIRINGQAVQGGGGGQRGGSGAAVTLPAGDHPFELLFTKNQDWGNRSLALMVSGPGIREYNLGDPVLPGGNADPILIDAGTTTILRSFVDLERGLRVVHAVNVGSQDGVHYTYDLDRGNVIWVWRGGFLDATPMWYSRGDGSSRPLGAVQRLLQQPSFTLAKLGSADAAWTTDTAGTGYTPKGYKLDKMDQPTFRYGIYGIPVEDALRPLENGQGLRREIITGPGATGMYARLAWGNTIETAPGGLYLVDGKSYYIRVDDNGGSKPVIRDSNGKKELIVPVQGRLVYSILY